MDERRARELVAEREAARRAKDFGTADQIRDDLLAAGWSVKDTPSGGTIERAPLVEAVDPARIQNALHEPPALVLSIHLLYEGFIEDLKRFLGSFAAHNETSGIEVVVVDNASAETEAVRHVVGEYPFSRLLHLQQELGWASARNAGLKTARGGIIVLLDLSIEPTGDVVSPILRVFDEPVVGVAGPFGLVSDDMRSWREDAGPEVDAVEGYLMAIRREALVPGLINDRFKWYRNADIDLSFQIRSLGYEARVVPLPVEKHAHRGWTSLGEEERAKRSKRNHYVFFDRWKEREDLLISRRRGVR
jgi:cysteinyl-tRNA synthetase